MAPALARLDHVIQYVPDIRLAHSELMLVQSEAWPIGPFWPGALTSGIAMGGFNLELIQEEVATVPFGPPCLAFEPTSLANAEARFRACGIEFERFEKVESDPGLLRLRGFTEADSATPRWICTNLAPRNSEALAFEFFLCDYSPFLRAWLSPDHPRFAGLSRVNRILYGTPDVVGARQLLDALGYAGDVKIDFVEADQRGVVGPVPWWPSP
jgi:hypothetical protein